MSLESGTTLCRLNHELLPEPGSPIASTTIPFGGRAGALGTMAGIAGACGAAATVELRFQRVQRTATSGSSPVGFGALRFLHRRTGDTLGRKCLGYGLFASTPSSSPPAATTTAPGALRRTGGSRLRSRLPRSPAPVQTLPLTGRLLISLSSAALSTG